MNRNKLRQKEVQMKERTVTILLCIFLMFGLILPNPSLVFAAIKEYTVNETEYNLPIEDYPTFTAEWDSIYAKMNNNKTPKKYILSLFDDYASTDATLEAFEKMGMSVSSDECYGVEITLYRQEADEEYYPTEGTVNVELICPLPDVFLDTPTRVQIYQLENGRNKEVNFALAKVNDVVCAKFTVNKNAIYSFGLTDKDVDYDEIIKPSTTPVPTKKPTPTVTQTPKPTNPPTPTKKPAISNSGSSTTHRPKDETPQTGDASTPFTWMVLSVCSGIGMVYLLAKLKK